MMLLASGMVIAMAVKTEGWKAGEGGPRRGVKLKSAEEPI